MMGNPKPKDASDLRFTMTAYTPPAPSPRPSPNGRGSELGAAPQWQAGNGSPLTQAQYEQANTPAVQQRISYTQKMPKWFDINRDQIEVRSDGIARIRPTNANMVEADRRMAGNVPFYNRQFDDNGDQFVDLGTYGKDWGYEYGTDARGQWRRLVIHQNKTLTPTLSQEGEGAQAGEQQFGLTPGDPEKTLRGGLAQFMGNPVVKIGETALGGTLPGAIVGSAILPGIGTIAGAAVGTGLSLLAGQQQFDENNIPARALAGLGGAAIGQALIPIPMLGALIGGAAGLIAGPQILDLGRQTLEQAIGTGEQLIGSATNPEKYGTFDEATRDLKATWEAARNTYESSTLDVRALSPDGWGKYDLFNNEDKVFVDWDLPAINGGLTAVVEARRRIAAGENPTLVNAEIAARYGAPGQLRELGSGFVLDPLNYAGEIQKVGLRGVAKVTGDELLAQAAREAGHGGFVDALQRYKSLLTNEKLFRDGFNEAQDLNRLQRMVIGEDLMKLAVDGKYEQPKWWEVWKLTPDSQAKDRVVQADNFIQAYLSQIPVDENYGDKALRVLKNLKDGPQYGPIENGLDEVVKASQTVEGQIVRKHLDVTAAEDTVQAWGQTNDLRDEVARLADRVGESPTSLVSRIHAAAQEEGGIDRLVNEWNVPSSLTSIPQGEGISAARLSTIDKVFGGGDVPFTPEHLKAAIISGQIEASAKWAVNVFGIKPPPFLERVAAAVKAVQSSVLLGVNPGYVVNNIINGEVTMAARGVWGLRGIVEARDTLARAGIEPARLASGGTIGDLDVAFNPGELLGKAQAAGMQEIAKAQQYEGTLSEISRAGRKLSEHLPATALAPKVEQAQSLRAFYEGWKQFMSQQWKRGRGLPKMDGALENAIRAVDPGMVDRLYAAAEAGLNPTEIASKVFAQKTNVVVQAHIGDAAARLGMPADDVARVLATDGIDELLNEGLDRAGDNAGKIRQVFDEARNQAEVARVQAHAEEVQTHAAYAVEAAKAGDAGELLNLMDDVEMRLYETYQSHMNALEEEWQRINSSGGKNSQLKQALIAAQRDRAGRQWQAFFDYEDAVTKGMADGMTNGGLQLDENFNTAARAKRAKIDQFNAEKNTLLDRFFALDDAARTPEEWAATTGAINAAYDRLTNDLSEVTARVDRYMAAEFARRYNTATGEAFTAWREGVQKYKQQDMSEVLAFRKQVSQMRDAAAKDAAWRSFNEARLKRLHEIEQQSIGLRRKVAEVMNLVTVDGGRTTGASADLTTVMNRRTFAENAVADMTSPAPSTAVAEAAASAQDATPMTIGERVVTTQEATAIADVVQREMALANSRRELAALQGPGWEPSSLQPMPPAVEELQTLRQNALQRATEWEAKAERAAGESSWQKYKDMADAQRMIADEYGRKLDRAISGQVTARDVLEDQVRAYVKMQRHEPQMTDAVMAVIDARSETWATQTGRPAEEYIPSHFAMSDQPSAVGGQLEQTGPMEAKGAVTFLDDGRAVLKAFGASDVSTAVHEVGHVFLRDLFDVANDASNPGAAQAAADLQTTREWMASEAINLSEAAARNELTPAQRQAFGFGEADTWIDAIDDNGNMTRAGQEIWARGFERYLSTGQAPTEGLRRVFEQFKEWIARMYRSIRGSEIDVNISADMRQVYDRMLSETAPTQTLTPGPSPIGEGRIARVENPQLLQRHELPGQLPQAMEDWARQAMSDLNAGTPGQRIFTGQGDVIGQSSTYPEWYKAMSARYGARKDQVLGALDKIIRDNGADTGLTVERLKELGLNELANGFEVVGAKIPGDPEAMQLLGRQVRPEDVSAWEAMQSELKDDTAGTSQDTIRLYRGVKKAAIGAEFVEPPSVDEVNRASEIFNRLVDGDPNGLSQQDKDWAAKVLQRNRRVRFYADDELSARKYAGTGGQVYYVDVPRSEARQYMKEAGNFSISGGEVSTYVLPFDVAKNANPLNSSTFYQSGPGELTVVLPSGERAVVNAIDDKTLTVNGQPVPIIAAGEAPLPPGVLADMGARPMPIAQALDESYANTLRPILNQLQHSIEDGMQRGPVQSAANLPADLQDGIRAWVDQVNGKLASTKLQATKWGEYKRDSALLNYSRRYKYNTYLGMVSPYEFFTTQSMVKWALHSIDRPQVLANYYRVSKFMNTEVTKAGFPSRLAGQLKIPLPFLPEWAGGGVFVDPMKVGLPLQNWAAPWEQEQSREQRLKYRITSTLDQWVDDGQITTAEAEAAKNQGGGELWDKASQAAVAKDPSLGADALDTAMAVMPPSLPLQFVMNKLRGKEGEITQLPIYRTAKAIGAMVGADAAVGNLDKSVRRLMDLPILDDWTAYRIDTELANLAAEGVITSDQAREAMISRSGPAYSLAEHREAQASEYSTVGSSVFGTSIALYPEGEQNLRKMQQLYAAAREAQDNGDAGALNKFFDQNPAYEARLALYKNPDERLRNFLVSKVWEKWQDMPRAYQQDVQQSFGPEFGQSFLNKETRSYEDIPIETLSRWARTMGQMIPGRPDTKPVPVQWSDPATAAQVEEYYNQRETLFDWNAVRKLQSEYYAIPYGEAVTTQVGVYKSGAKRGQPKYSSTSKRDIFIDQHPEYKKYLDWRKAYLKQFPNVQGFLDEQTALMDKTPSPQPSPIGEGVSPAAQRLVMANQVLGRSVPADVMEWLGVR